VETETASHILCECAALTELKFRFLGRKLTEQSNDDEIHLCKILLFVRGTGLLAECRRWGRKIYQKAYAVQGSPCAPTPLILICFIISVQFILRQNRGD
jgi:hypothetical protein